MSANGRKYLFDQLQRMINYAAKEFDLDYGEIVGVLEMQKLSLFMDTQNEGETEDVGQSDT